MKELMKYIPVDIIGDCSNDDLKCRRLSPECNELLNNYKFYLSFENSLCKDYVSDHAFEMFKNELLVIPIVMGGANYSKVAPPRSFIDVNDFVSTKQLADYLIYLDENDFEYWQYFWWREWYELADLRVGTAVAMCQLCEQLHHDRDHSSYDEFGQWWIEGGHCDEYPRWFTGTFPVSTFPLG